MDTTLDFTIKLAAEAGKRALSYYRTGGIQGNLKSDHTVVTEADLTTDKFLRSSIKDAFPGDSIISEEENTYFEGDTIYTWVIDPIDGTTNFSLGLHHWGVSIARLREGSPDLAALYFPLLDELFSAVRGGGAFLNGIRLSVNPDAPLRTETFFSCCSRTQQEYQVNIPYKTRIFGSAAYGLVSVARGSAALAFEVTPKIWDFSGSWLITQEAGGVIAPLDRTSVFPLQPGKDYGTQSYPVLAAPTQENWETGMRNINHKQPI